MPYEQEESSLYASGSYTKNILTDKNYGSLVFNDELNKKIMEGLVHLQSRNQLYHIRPDKSDIYQNLHCIDGSFLTIPRGQGEMLGLRVGNAILSTDNLFEIDRNNFGTPDPYHVAKLYSNDRNTFINGILPSKNVYHYENGEYQTLQKTFKTALDNIFEDPFAKEVKSQYLLGLKETDNAQAYGIKFSEIEEVSKIITDIREESIVFSTQKEVQKIMLISESMLAQYHLDNRLVNKKELIVLDGRLQNEDIGQKLNKITSDKIIDIDHMLIGVQKTGRLNLLLTKIHELIKTSDLPDLKSLKKQYEDGENLIFILDNKFKNKCGVPNSGNGSYGVDCLCITQAPMRKEFVFTLPQVLFEKNNNFDHMALFHSIASVFEYANTDLYILNKGVLLANVLSHAHVSLNKKQTKILGEAFEKEVPDTRKKPKI